MGRVPTILGTNFNNKYSGGQYEEVLDFNGVSITIFADTKYKVIHILISKKAKYKRKNIDLDQVIKYISDFIDNNNIFLSNYDELIKNDYLKREYVSLIQLKYLKINNNDLKSIAKSFLELKCFITTKCTFYSNCNIGILPVKFSDLNSTIYNLDSLNGYNGQYLYLEKTIFKNQNKNSLNLNCTVLELKKVNIDYEHFILTTKAPNLRRLDIINSRFICRHRDLLFISGFYNLEQININGFVHDWNQISKLDKLIVVHDLLCDNEKDLEQIKKLKQKRLLELSNKKDFDEKSYLMTQNLFEINSDLDFYYNIMVPKLERLEWKDKVFSKTDIDIKQELNMISNLTPIERYNIAREQVIANGTMFENFFGLKKKDTNVSEEPQYELVSSEHPFSDEKGIEYWTLKKEIKLFRKL